MSITIENVDVFGWEAAIRGLRNPKNSWKKSDSSFKIDEYSGECASDFIGENDLKLMKNLCKAGPDHRKFLRMINVTCDIVAPLYWVAEHDTYKVGTVRNSCSFMHKGVSNPFEIDDFSVDDERIYEILNPIESIINELMYPYETEEYRIYTTGNGREYKVYRNGRVVSCEFFRADDYGKGRLRHFYEKEVKPSIMRNGYFELNLGGRPCEKWFLHRLVATVWIDNANEFETVNHIDGNKGDNSVENLEWCSREANITKGFESGLYEKNKLHSSYIKWKNAHVVVDPFVKTKIKKEHSEGLTREEISRKYDIPLRTLNNILYIKPCENAALFESCYEWERTISELNTLRAEYLETKDESIFQTIRKKLPQGYNIRYTWQANYEVLLNIYYARRNHRLPEWVEFCKWIETLPYFKEICLGD